MQITRLDHVTVSTPDELEGEVIEWYERVLGLERLAKPEGSGERGAWFRCGDREIHIQIDPHNPPNRPHFCVVVEAFDDAVTHLRASGCHIEQATTIVGRRRCFTRDPAGNRIEVMSYTGDGH